MALSALDDKSHQPRAEELAGALGRSLAAWEALRAHLAAEYPPLTEKWAFGGAKWGWTLRLIQKKRTVLYMTPLEKRFLVGFILGEKAVAATLEVGLSAAVSEVIDDAPRYGEGRGVRLEVQYKKDLPDIEKIAAAKMAN